MPPISVTSRDERITTRHKVHAEDKVQKLQRYFDRILKIQVVLGHGPTDAEADLIISVAGGKTLVCHATGQDPYAAVDVVLDKAEMQLTRHKEKLKDHRGVGLGEPEVHEAYGSSEEDGPSDEKEDLVEKKELS